MFLCYDCTLKWFHRRTSFCIFNEICKGISDSAIFNNPPRACNTPNSFLNGSNCDLRAIPNRACTERLCESILKDQIELHSVQLPLLFEILLWIFFQFTSFIFLLFSIVINFLGVGKMGGPWAGVHGPGPYFDGPGPWTGSTEGVHGPGVHVLYFPSNGW